MHTVITYWVHNCRQSISILLFASHARYSFCCSCVWNKWPINVMYHAQDMLAQSRWSLSAAKLKLRYLNRCLQPKLRINRHLLQLCFDCITTLLQALYIQFKRKQNIQQNTLLTIVSVINPPVQQFSHKTYQSLFQIQRPSLLHIQKGCGIYAYPIISRHHKMQTIHYNFTKLWIQWIPNHCQGNS